MHVLHLRHKMQYNMMNLTEADQKFSGDRSLRPSIPPFLPSILSPSFALPSPPPSFASSHLLRRRHVSFFLLFHTLLFHTLFSIGSSSLPSCLTFLCKSSISPIRLFIQAFICLLVFKPDFLPLDMQGADNAVSAEFTVDWVREILQKDWKHLEGCAEAGKESDSRCRVV